MRLERKWLGVAAGLTAVVLALGAVVVIPRVAAAHGGFGRMGGPGGFGGPDGDTYLADALGITTEALQAAQQKAMAAAVDQAVAKDLLTEEQAETLKDRADALKDRSARGFGKLGHFGAFGGAIDIEPLLAEALGISVDKLRAARDKAFEAGVKAALDDGRITAAQADTARARHALDAYLRQQGVPGQMRTAFDEAVKGAVKAGVITQKQADALKSGPGFGPHGFGGCPGFGGRGMRGGGFGGRWLDRDRDSGTGTSTGTAFPGSNL